MRKVEVAGRRRWLKCESRSELLRRRMRPHIGGLKVVQKEFHGRRMHRREGVERREGINGHGWRGWICGCIVVTVCD